MCLFLLQCLEYFEGESVLETHIRENPCLLGDWGNIWPQLRASGWEIKGSVVSLKAFPSGSGSCIEGVHMFPGKCDMLAYIQRWEMV